MVQLDWLLQTTKLNVGGVASFYAGATGDEGQAAKISFGSDGRIRGSGAYVRDRFGDESEFLIVNNCIWWWRRW